MTAAITPFRIHVDDAVLADLHRRLDNTRWPDHETVDDWSQGLPLAYARELCDYWRHGYDWRAREARLNRFAQVMVHLGDVDIHAIHVRSPHPQARPLVMTHGWPGSIVEFHKVIDALVDPVAHGGRAEDAFHLVCPSLPGYGFSSKPRQSGWGVERIADTWTRLMAELGYPHFLAQGGDWGSLVTTMIGARHAGPCRGIHVTMPVVGPDKDTLGAMTDQEKAALAALERYRSVGSGYSTQQATRPQTLAYGLADSPSGQAAWIVEKFQDWMDCDGHPETVLTRDELLDNVMLYWVTNAAGSSARLYWESFAKASREPLSLPSGISMFPKEIFRTSRRWAERRYTGLRYWNELPRGGHFAAMEQPEVFVREVRACFDTMR